jgi:predicted membrane protein (TIGR00267 family)
LSNDDDFVTQIRTAMSMPETGPALRRYFVNTIFDSTFVILGVIIGSAFATDPSYTLVIATILTSSFALGISTGVSVYEAETMEQDRRIKEIEAAMLSSLEDTEIRRLSRISILMIAIVNFSAPLMACAVAIAPFLILGESDVQLGGWVASALALVTLFVTGALMGRISGRNPVVRGTRMAIIGAAVFLICFWIQTLI